MDIGDYIYLILALLLGLFSALKKKKAKNEEQEEMPDFEEPESQPRPNPMDEIFGDFTLSDEEFGDEPIETEPPAKEPEVKTEEPKIYKPTESLTTFQSHVAEKIATIEKENHLKNHTKEKKQPKKQAFDLKKAVIYSEILNRKY